MALPEFRHITWLHSSWIRLSCTAILSGLLFPKISAAEPLHVEGTFFHGAQTPTIVPVPPSLSLKKQVFYGPLVGVPAAGQGYQPADGNGFLIHNGKGAFNCILTTGTWWLRAGDRPRLRLDMRTTAGAYALPGLLPDIGVTGDFRVQVTANEKTKWLDQFDSIDATLYAGSVRWRCQDNDLGISIELEALRLVGRPWGFSATTRVSAESSRKVTLTWAVDKATHVADHGSYVQFSSGKYAQIFAGLADSSGTVSNGQVIVELTASPSSTGDSHTNTCRYLCIWGYSDYNHEGVADAYHRLEFRPFDSSWLEKMKPKWFDHWIGDGLEPEKKFLNARDTHEALVQETRDFWDRQQKRLQVHTPDVRLDTVINHVSARARAQFEYPGFMHGVVLSKYGKINHGYYGFEAAGMHEEVADSLQLVAGTQDVKGRQRYIMTTFAISDWHEDMDFYFVEQCWWHWRWTGDNEFLKRIWPAARRALEHGLAVSDPDGDNIMTGYYEMWDSDQNNSGGFSALQTAMAWTALRAAHDMATALGDVDYVVNNVEVRPIDPDYSRRYKQRAEKVREQYLKHFWSPQVGAWSSSEVNGLNRPRPHTSEENYPIWRGIGEPMQNYTAMRYVRENLHFRDLLPGSTFEFINDWWPVQWSHHYVASGDTCASVHSACGAGDTDGFWDAFKTIAESAYLNGGEPWEGTGSDTMELEPLFLNAVVDGLFGVKPFFGENLLVLRPAFPRTWHEVEISHRDVSYHYKETAEGTELVVQTPVPRRFRAEVPVRWSIREASVNGKGVAPEFETAVNSARVKLESPIGKEHKFVLHRAADHPAIHGELAGVVGVPMVFEGEDLKVVHVHDPQAAVSDVKISNSDDRHTKISFKPVRVSKPTVFLEVQASNATWLAPLDLSIQKPWSIVERYLPGLYKGGPALLSPQLNPTNQTLTVEIANGSATAISENARIQVVGETFQQPLNIETHRTQSVVISLRDVWDRLSPGTIPIQIELAGHRETNSAACWDLRSPKPAWKEKLRPIDLGHLFNANTESLFGPQTQWRIDYTGAQHGVDWRQPPPARDERGYILLNSVMSVFEFGVLPEQGISAKRARFNPNPPNYGAALDLTFQTASNRVLAICCTQPYDQFSSRVTLKLNEPCRAAKLYLLTANIAKTLKCYYPAAEVLLQYSTGQPQLEQLIPPYTFPSLVSSICPKAYPIPVGDLHGGGNAVADSKCYFSITDLVLDQSRALSAIEFRSVATETLLGIVGATLLDASDSRVSASR